MRSLAWASGSLFAAGIYRGPGDADFNDGRTLPSEGDDAVVVELDLQGTTRAATRLGGSGTEELNRIAALPNGTIGAVGRTNSPNFRVGNTDPQPGTDQDAFVTEIGVDGDVRWTVRLLGTGASEATGITSVEYQGEPAIVISGMFSGVLELGNQTLTAATGSDTFVSLFRLDGSHLYTTRIVSSGDSGNVRVGARDRSLYVAGAFSGQLTLTNAIVDSVGLEDVFLQQLLP
jgi:hypothetical protein